MSNARKLSKAIQPEALVVNEDSADFDFRAESNSDTHGIFLDAANSTVGINSNDTGYGYSLVVNGHGGAPTGTSADTRDRASLRLSSTGSTGTTVLGTGTSLFMGVEDSTAVWVQGQHISDNSEKTLKLNPAGGAVQVPRGSLQDSTGVPMMKYYHSNYGGDRTLYHSNGFLGVTGDPSPFYVLLCPAYAGTIKNPDAAMGRIFRQRGSSSNGNITTCVEYYVQSAYNNNQGGGIRYGNFANTDIVTCVYGGTTYIALSFNNSSASYVSCDSLWSNHAPILVDDSAVSSVSAFETLVA